MLIIKNGLIHDIIHKEPFISDILVKNGKIAAVGKDLAAEGEVFDAMGRNIYPGFIDAHSHLGLSGWGIGYEGIDYNEMSDYCTPQLRAIDSLNPLDPSVAMAAKAGVTCVATGPGSANAIGGTWIAIKTHGICADDMIVKDPVAMKGALGENPKRCYKDKGISARMSTAARMREMMYATLDYMARKEAAGDDPLRKPAYNMKYEAMIPVMKKEIPMKIHAHQANDIITAIRIAKEFDLKLTIEHVTEGHLIADVLERNKQYPMAVGPTLSHASKFELQNKSWTTAGILAERGCHVSIITDSPFSPQEHLPLIAGMAVKGGMDPYEALKAITLNPAEHLGIADRVGSIETGKDADLVICKGNPFTLESEIEAVFIDGIRI